MFFLPVYSTLQLISDVFQPIKKSKNPLFFLSESKKNGEGFYDQTICTSQRCTLKKSIPNFHSIENFSFEEQKLQKKNSSQTFSQIITVIIKSNEIPSNHLISFITKKSQFIHEARATIGI